MIFFFFFNGYPAVPQSQLFGLKASKPLRGDANNVGVASAGNVSQASTSAAQENALEWVKKDKRRMLHVVYRVGDLDRTIKYVALINPMTYFFFFEAKYLVDRIFGLIMYSVDCRFYTECLGMKLLRKRDIPEERYTNAFLGYGPEDSHFVIELTYSKLSDCSFIC